MLIVALFINSIYDHFIYTSCLGTTTGHHLAEHVAVLVWMKRNHVHTCANVTQIHDLTLCSPRKLKRSKVHT